MTRGRKPISHRVQRLKGQGERSDNRKARQGNESEPRPAAMTSLEPHIVLVGEARLVWDRIVPELSRLGVATSVDVEALTVYCQAWGDYAKASAMLQEQGLVVTPEGSKAAPRVNPWCKVQKDAVATLRAYSAILGLDPSSRPRIVAQGTEKEELDDFDEFMKG